MNKRKVFGVGLSRTGTRSLCEALTLLGYKTAHCTVEGGGLINPDRFADGEYDAAADIATAGQFEEFARLYPDARFILTLRDLDAWLRSLRGHFFRNPEEIERFRAPGDPLCAVFQRAYGARPPLEWSDDWWAARYSAHKERVFLHLVKRLNHLLKLRICEGDSWGPLCEFLDEPVPDVPFPRAGTAPPAEREPILRLLECEVPALLNVFGSVPGPVLEVGTGDGLFVAQAATQFPGRVFDCVDSFKPAAPDKFAGDRCLWEVNVPCDKFPTVTLYEGRSDDILPALPRKYGAIFIDADHAHDAVLADARNAWRLLLPEGILIFHDYFSHDAVALAVETFAAEVERSVEPVVGTMAVVARSGNWSFL